MAKTRVIKKSKPIDSWVFPGDESCDRNVLALLFFSYLRRELSEKDVFEFFRQLPEFREIPESALRRNFERLRHECDTGPLCSAGSMLVSLDRYLHSKQINFNTGFCRFIEQAVYRSPDAFTSYILPEFQPLLERFGVKEFLLSLAYLIPRILIPRAKSKIVQSGRSGATEFVVIAVESSVSGTAAVDAEIGLGPLLQLFPVLFGATPFSGFSVIAEESSVTQKINGFHAVAVKKTDVFIDDERIGRIVDFSHFLRDIGAQPMKGYLASACVVVPDDDFFCPKRQRIVLKKSCAYGAPVSIVKVSHRPIRPIRQNDGGAADTREPEPRPPVGRPVRPPAPPDSALRVTFHRRLQSISVGGAHVTSGVQAHILRFAFDLHQKNGYCEFDWKELAAERDLICDPCNTGLSTRLARAAQCLSRVTDDVDLEKFGRGKYRLACKRKILYSEI